MSPNAAGTRAGAGRVPRASGDEPDDLRQTVVVDKCSPRERG